MLPCKLVGMVNQPKTPLWALRVDRELKARAMAKAEAEGRTLSEVVREFLEGWVEEP